MNALSIVVEGHDEEKAATVVSQALSLAAKLNCPVKMVYRGQSLYIEQGDNHGDLIGRLNQKED